MDFKQALEVIRKDLEETGALLDQLAVTPGTQVAEIELARSRVRSATEMLKLLPKLNAAPSITTAEDRAAPRVEKEVAGKKSVAEPVMETKAVKDETANQSFTAQKSSEASRAILADKLGNSAGTIGEKKSAVKQDEVITSVIHSKPISDIAAAIGINDRFYFIRELFSGDSLAYQDTITRLNEAVSLGEAMKILDESTVMGSDPAAQSSFVDIVRRKFNVNV